MKTNVHQILDSKFQLHSEGGGERFFERMSKTYADSALVNANRAPIEIHVHQSSLIEMAREASDWKRSGHFHRSSNYSHWDLVGPVDAGAIFLPEQGLLFRNSPLESRLDIHVDARMATRADELIFHAARNLSLWRRGHQFWGMLHASAVVFDGAVWLFLGNKAAGKSTLFIDSVLRQGGSPLANDRVLLDGNDGRTVWSWPSYLSYCEGTILDYPELRAVFDVGLQEQRPAEADAWGHALYRRSYEQAHKRIVPPFFFSETLNRTYIRQAPIAGVVSATLTPGHPYGATLRSTRSTAQLQMADIASAVFPVEDPDFPKWHGDRHFLDQVCESSSSALAWLRSADVPFLEITLDPVNGKHGLRKLLNN